MLPEIFAERDPMDPKIQEILKLGLVNHFIIYYNIIHICYILCNMLQNYKISR